MDFLEKIASQFLIWRLRVGYGDCETSDLDDFSEMYKGGSLAESVIDQGRCAGCRAKETIIFLKSHSELLNDY